MLLGLWFDPKNTNFILTILSVDKFFLVKVMKQSAILKKEEFDEKLVLELIKFKIYILKETVQTVVHNVK